MEIFDIKDISFSYPGRKEPAIKNISLKIESGEFITLCGKSGCGKSTFLRCLKPSLTPYGDYSGEILFYGKNLTELDLKEESCNIGFVFQNPDNQIVTDKVWHELSFGLENLGYSDKEIGLRIAEMASFFGIQAWFDKKVCELSGGQKQLLNLASVMVMQPKVLILDEPTSRLDPVSAKDFIDILSRLNKDFGITVIICEHRLEELFSFSDKIMIMENGTVSVYDNPKNIVEAIKENNSDFRIFLPTCMRIYDKVNSKKPCPLTVREARSWLKAEVDQKGICENYIKDYCGTNCNENIIELKDIWFRYSKDEEDVIKGMSFSVKEGEIFSIVGGNGTGKTTTLKIIAGINKHYRGKKSIKKEKIISMLPQDPQSVFVKKTVLEDLYEGASECNIPKEAQRDSVKRVVALCGLEDLLHYHPYDLSGGEQQRAALAKVLLTNPDILLLDEPTKGIDAQFKLKLADIFNNLKSKGITIVMISHDAEFCSRYSDRCAMFFNGKVVSVDSPREFFKSNSFYTTAAARMAKDIINDAIYEEDVLRALGVRAESDKKTEPWDEGNNCIELYDKKNKGKNSVLGIFFLIIAITVGLIGIISYNNMYCYLVSVGCIMFSVLNFIPEEEINVKSCNLRTKNNLKSLFVSMIFLLCIIPLTIYFGTHFLKDRKYYFISLLLITETVIPFLMMFENRKPRAREIVLISGLSAIAVAGRLAFLSVPQFKPMVAIVVISGVCLGYESGFLIGIISGFVSNFFFGQGPWTPWQMFALGLVGFISGLFFNLPYIKKTKASLCIFGGLITFFLYGGIMNISSAVMSQPDVNSKMITAYFITGLPFDTVHSISTILFMWILSKSMIEKIERIKIKYGMIKI